MSTKLRTRRAAVPLKTYDSDEELMILTPQSTTDSELDWSYTARCTKEWSGDELLSYLCSKAFTIPPRDYNPSAPFVYVKTEDGVITPLPHGYRIPLMFIAKYQWETTNRTLSLHNRQRWEAVRDEIYHLARLCDVLFSKARAKAESSGMEKGWRCVMFDRVLTRFYKGWPVSSPVKLEAFTSHFGSKEYERDVLKYDWKRWALKGFFRPSSSPTIHLTEEDVNGGVTAVDLKIRLSKIDNIWTLRNTNNLKRRPIKFMQPTDGSSSELTDFDLSLDEDEDVEITSRNANLDLPQPFVVETPTKRSREASEDDDSKNKAGKRAKLEEIVRSISSLPCTPIVSSDGPPPLGSGDGFDEDHDSLPKFKVPRQILHSYGWKPRSAMKGLAKRSQREEQGEEEEEEAGTGTGADVLPACDFGDASTSIHNPSSIGPDKNGSNALSKSVLQRNMSPTSPGSMSLSTKSKGKQPESASTNPTSTTTTSTAPTTAGSRNLRNSAYVSLPSSSRMTKLRTRPPATIPPPSSPEVSSFPITRRKSTNSLRSGRRLGKLTYGDEVLPSSEVPSWSPVAGRKGGRHSGHKNRCVTTSMIIEGQDRRSREGTGADSDTNMGETNVMKTKRNGKSGEEKMGGVQHSELSSSLSTNAPLTNMEDNNDDVEGGEQGATATAIPESQRYSQIIEDLGLIPRTVSMAYSVPSSSALSSLSSSPSPSASGPLVPHNGGVDVVADADAEYGTQQMKNRIRELKTRFMGFRDDLERIIGRLGDLEGGEVAVAAGDGGLMQGSSSDHPNFISQVAQTEDKQGRKGKERDVGIEMTGVSRAIPGYVNVAVEVDADASAVLKDVSVQTDELHSTSGTIVLQTIDGNAVTPLPATDDVTKKTIIPTLSLESKTQCNSTGSLSTMVDNLVSIKMLTMMQSLVTSNIGRSTDGKAKPMQSSSTTTNANAATAAATNTNTTNPITTQHNSDITAQTSPSPISFSISAASHSTDAYDNILTNLLDELKTIKEEARCREQSEKEDLLAMRQLHSAEVDALRRRLSYLESRNLSLGRWDTNGGSGSGRWKGSRVDGSRIDDSLESDRHHHHRYFEDGASFRQHQQYGDRSNQDFSQNGLVRHSSSSTPIINPEGAPRTNNSPTLLSKRGPNRLRGPSLPSLSVSTSTATTATDSSSSTVNSNNTSSSSSSLPTPTPHTPSDRYYSFGFSKNNGMDLDDDGVVNHLPLPLPIKSQRKHHMMALARAHFS